MLGPQSPAVYELARDGYAMIYQSRRLLVSTQPFGVIEYFIDPDGTPLGGERFQPARQINQGQLGRYPEIPKLPFVRQAKEDGRGATARDRRRSHIGWVRLTGLAFASGLTFEQILFDYWPFIDYRYDRRYPVRQTLDMLFDHDPHDIRNQTGSQLDIQQVDRIAMRRLHENRWEYMENWQDVWVRKGFAQTILYLNALGYVPSDIRLAV